MRLFTGVCQNRAERWGVNKASGLKNEPGNLTASSRQIKKKKKERQRGRKKSELRQERWAGGIMGYCEFRPTGNGRPASNPTALARYLQNEQCCLQVTQNAPLCCSGLRFLIIAPFFTHRAHLNVPIIYSVTYSHLLSCAVWFYECSLKR